jgi:hypothetical protein
LRVPKEKNRHRMRKNLYNLLLKNDELSNNVKKSILKFYNQVAITEPETYEDIQIIEHAKVIILLINNDTLYNQSKISYWLNVAFTLDMIGLPKYNLKTFISSYVKL